MAELKTKRNDQSVEKFINAIADESKKGYSLILVEMMKKITGEEPEMWGDSIVGFGTYHYKYESGREGDWFISGFSPRKQSMTLYIMPGFERFPKIMSKLGKYKLGKACLYIKKLEDVDLEQLQLLVKEAFEYMKKKYKT